MKLRNSFVSRYADTVTFASGLAKTSAAALVGAGVWGFGIEPHLFTIKRTTLPVLPPGSTPLRVLHISDLHLAPWQKHKMSWVRRLADLEPDLVINTGDNFGWDCLEEVTYALAPLSKFPGVFVLGSNDYYGPELKNPARYLVGPSQVPVAKKYPNLPTGQLVARLQESGWQHLDNQRAELSIRGVGLNFAGLGDTHMDAARASTQHPAFAPGADVRIGVTHSPYSAALDAFSSAGAQAIFAGHTHGGQIRVPGWGALVTNCDRPRNEARGTFQRDGAYVHISAGLGFSVFAPVRFACLPEVSLVTLAPRKP